MSEFRPLTVRDADAYDWDGSRDRVIELSGQGYGPLYISKATGLSVRVVEKIRKSEFQDRNANRQQIVEAHAQTVQWLKLKLTERIAAAGGKWDRRDGELLLKVLERESRLFGCDQPVQVQHDVNVTVEQLSDDDLLKALAAEGIVVQQLNPPPAPAALPEHIEDAVILNAQP